MWCDVRAVFVRTIIRILCFSSKAEGVRVMGPCLCLFYFLEYSTSPALSFPPFTVSFVAQSTALHYSLSLSLSLSLFPTWCRPLQHQNTIQITNRIHAICVYLTEHIKYMFFILMSSFLFLYLSATFTLPTPNYLFATFYFYFFRCCLFWANCEGWWTGLRSSH